VRRTDFWGRTGPARQPRCGCCWAWCDATRARSGCSARDPADDALAALQGVTGIIEEPRLYPCLGGRANLQLLSDLDLARAGGRRLEEVLETVELRDRAKDRVSECLQGMRQRLGIAGCLVRNPKLMPLDEPAKGVDPAGMRFLRQLLLRLREEGVTVLTSSHLLAEVQEICTRVAFISAGRIAYEGPLDDLLARAGRRYRLETSQLERTAEICRDVAGLSAIEVDPDRIGFAVDGERALVELASALAEAEEAIAQGYPHAPLADNSGTPASRSRWSCSS
jgi:ABC-2 type transport system ATP-binding protein